jgi:hypothetical protein
MDLPRAFRKDHWIAAEDRTENENLFVWATLNQSSLAHSTAPLAPSRRKKAKLWPALDAASIGVFIHRLNGLQRIPLNPVFPQMNDDRVDFIFLTF